MRLIPGTWTVTTPPHCVHAPGVDPGFWSRGAWCSFDPTGGPEPKICSKQGFSPKKSPENCMMLNKSWGQGGQAPGAPGSAGETSDSLAMMHKSLWRNVTYSTVRTIQECFSSGCWIQESCSTLNSAACCSCIGEREKHFGVEFELSRVSIKPIQLQILPGTLYKTQFTQCHGWKKVCSRFFERF